MNITRMVLQNGFTQHRAVYVRIDFCRTNGFVPKHHLDGAQVGTTFKQVCGKGVAKRVRTHETP